MKSARTEILTIERLVILKLADKAFVEKDVIEQEIKQKFGEIGVTVMGIETKRSYSGEFKGSIVKTSMVNLNRIWGRRLGISECSIIAFDPQ